MPTVANVGAAFLISSFSRVIVLGVKLDHAGGLAQLVRASALHAEGRRFDSDILHSIR